MVDSIDSYIASFPSDVQIILGKIRAVANKAAPDAIECISYGIPTLRLNGTYLIYFAAFKKHVSLYPLLPECPGFEDELAPYRSGRATAKFPLDQPIPLPLIARIIEFMARDNARRTASEPDGRDQKLTKPSRLSST